MKTIHVKGIVFSGSGEGAKFFRLPWVIKQIKEKFGFTPYPGTLNIRLAEKHVRIKKTLKKARTTEITPENGFCRGKCFRAYFMDALSCAIVVPEIEGYPEDVMELMAPMNLREKFQLKDGGEVEVKIFL